MIGRPPEFQRQWTPAAVLLQVSSAIGLVLMAPIPSLFAEPTAMSSEIPKPGEMVVGPRADTGPLPGAVVFEPIDNITELVALHPPGTKYFFKPGIYRTQAIFPKDNDIFIGAHGATLNGARQLSEFQRVGGLYVAHNQAPHPAAEQAGVCMPEFPRCNRPQDLYFNGRPLRAVSSLSEVRSGTWYFAYDRNDVYFYDAPKGNIVEISYTPFAFGGAAHNVTIRNLIVENYACADQQGAINNHGAGVGWLIMNNDVRWNHGYGIVMGTANKILGNNVHHNGEMGLGGGSGTHDGLVENNELASNSWNGTNCDWECGGGKWGNVTHLSVVGNYVHDNEGNGLWTDERSSAILFDSNMIENNRRAGISHEISHAAVISNNVLRANGTFTHRWGWDAQIQVQNATDTDVHHNIIVLDPVRGGNGITVIQQSRGVQFKPRNVSIHDNDVTMARGDGAVAGWFAEMGTGAFVDANNHFDRNHYHIVSPIARPLWVANKFGNFQAWQAAGGDPHGTVDTTVAADP
jgi:hypothetical protein